MTREGSKCLPLVWLSTGRVERLEGFYTTLNLGGWSTETLASRVRSLSLQPMPPPLQ